MATSSARYTDLYDYTSAARQINIGLIGQAAKLGTRLALFEATCREPGFRVGGGGLGASLGAYGAKAEPVDEKVRLIGERFQRADSRAGSFSTGLYPIGIGPAFFSPYWPMASLSTKPTLMSSPTSSVETHNGVKTFINWLDEAIKRIIEALRPGRVAPPAADSDKTTNPVIIEVIHKPEPPTPKMVRAEDVPITIDRQMVVAPGLTKEERIKKFTPYPRGEGGTKSNCTWYAATALAAYTQGRIDLHAVHGDDRMSQAYHWPVEAEEAMENEAHPLHGFVTGVNKKPAPGTVITFDKYKGDPKSFGHVAWVEEAELVTGEDGKKYWKLVISEENYGGGSWRGAERIETGDDTVYRWRRTVTYPADDADDSVAITDGIRFIHWNPDYTPDKPA